MTGVNNPEPLADVPPPVSPQPAVKRWRWWIHLLLITAYPLVIGILGAHAPDTRGPALSRTARGILIVSSVELLIFGVVVGLAWLASRASRDDLLLRWRNGIWTIPLGIGYSVALRVALSIMVIAIGFVLILTRVTTPDGFQQYFMANRPDVEAVVDISAMRENPAYYWLTITFVSFVLAGLREELWRSAFLGGMKSLWPRRFGSTSGQIAAAAFAAVVFGFGHLTQGSIAVGATALLGFGLGLVMVLHRSIWPAVIAHGMFDATSLAVLPWAMEQLQQLQRSLGH